MRALWARGNHSNEKLSKTPYAMSMWWCGCPEWGTPLQLQQRNRCDFPLGVAKWSSNARSGQVLCLKIATGCAQVAVAAVALVTFAFLLFCCHCWPSPTQSWISRRLLLCSNPQETRVSAAGRERWATLGNASVMPERLFTQVISSVTKLCIPLNVIFFLNKHFLGLKQALRGFCNAILTIIVDFNVSWRLRAAHSKCSRCNADADDSGCE